MKGKTNYRKKVSIKDTEVINLVTKKIHKYNLPTKILSVSYMKLNGRHPEGKKKLLEKDCSYIMFVTEGKGKYIINEDIIEVKPQDVVFVRAGSTFVAEGKFEYLTVVVPAFYPNTTEEIE